MRVSWRGKPAELVTVGEGGSYSFSTLQAALDSLSGDTPTVVAVSRHVDTYSTPVQVNASNLAIVADGSYPTIVVTGGDARAAVWIGEDVEGVEDEPPSLVRDSVELEGLRVLFDCPTVGTTSAAILLGWLDDLSSRVPDYRNWDHVRLSNLIVETHSACLRAEGPSNMGVDGVSHLELVGCYLRSENKVVQTQGNIRYRSVRNVYVADKRYEIPGVDLTAGARQYGILHNPTSQRLNEFGLEHNDVHEESAIVSISDRFEIADASDLPSPGGGAQNWIGAVAVYQSNFPGVHQAPATLSARAGAPPVWLVDPLVDVTHDADNDPTRGVFGVGYPALSLAETTYGAGWRAEMHVSGGSIRVRQINTGSSAPAEVWGAFVRAGEADPDPAVPLRTIYLDGTTIHVTNSKAGGVGYSLKTDDIPDRIVARVYSDQAASSPRGTISARGVVP